MGDNYYARQLLMQQRIHYASAIMAALLILATGIVVFKAMKDRRRRRAVTSLLLVVFLSLGMGQKSYAESSTHEKQSVALHDRKEVLREQEDVLHGQEDALHKQIAEISLTEGIQTSEENVYDSPVSVRIRWSVVEEAFLKIEYSADNFAEALELDLGYGTSMEEQMQMLGVSWIRLTDESGEWSPEAEKELVFLVKEEGNYTFRVFDQLLSFRIGKEKEADETDQEGPEGEHESDSGNPQMPETGGRPDKEKTDTEKTDTEKTDKEENRGEDTPVIEEPDRKAPEVSMDLFLFTDAYGRQITTVNTIKLHVGEEHFDPEWMPEVKTTVKDGWTFSGWREKADGADGVITLKKDGEYEVTFQCRDQAGNLSERISSGRFLLDKTSPAITIEGVQNRGAYASPVTPLVYIEDPSFDLSQITCTLRGAKTGELDVGQLAEMVRTDQGVAISWDRFAGAADDVYTLSVQAQDQAGNTSEEEIVFAMDQNGSSYIISDATKKLMEDYYTAEPIELVLSEINTSAVVYEISLSKDGQPVLLEEGKDYSVEVRGGDGDWLIYVYRIFASNFEKEGVYHVDLTSWDQADNVNNSQMRGARIDFAVDHTPPVLLVENLEDGAWYKEKEHPFLIRTTDKTKLACLRVLVDGHIVLDKKDFANKESFTLKESNKEQVVQVLAVDKAGNQVVSEEYKVMVQHNEKLVPKEIREKGTKEKKESGSESGREQPEQEQENLLQKKGRTITFTVVVLLLVMSGISASVWNLYRRKNRKK